MKKRRKEGKKTNECWDSEKMKTYPTLPGIIWYALDSCGDCGDGDSLIDWLVDDW